MTRPADRFVAGAFWEACRFVYLTKRERNLFLTICDNARKAEAGGADRQIDMHTSDEKVSTSPEHVKETPESLTSESGQITIKCPRCPANMPIGLSCKGNPPDDPCPLAQRK